MRIPESEPNDEGFEGDTSHIGLHARAMGIARQLTSHVIRERFV